LRRRPPPASPPPPPPPAPQPVRRTGGAVPDDDRVAAHRLEGERGVLEALALRDAAALGREVDDVGGEPLCGQFEGDARAGGVLEEEVHHRAAAQRGQLLDLAAGQRGLDLRRGVEHQGGVGAVEVRGLQQVTLHCAASVTRTSSAPSVSLRWTFTCWVREVGTFLPTKSARIGSSRGPRATSTARWAALGGAGG